MHGRLMHLVQSPLESSLIAGKKYSKPGTWGRKPGWRQALFWLKSPIVQRKGIEGGCREERLGRSEGPSVPFPGRATTQAQWTIWPPEGPPLCKQLPWLADALYSRSVWLKYQRVTREHAVWPISQDTWNQCSDWCHYLKVLLNFSLVFLLLQLCLTKRRGRFLLQHDNCIFFIIPLSLSTHSFTVICQPQLRG